MLEVTGATEVTADVTGAAAEVTVDVTGAAAEVTGLEAVVTVAEPVGDEDVVAEVTGAVAGATADVTVAVADVAGVVADVVGVGVDAAVEVAALVAEVLVTDAEVAGATADVTGAVAVATVEVTVDVTEPEPVVRPGTAGTAAAVALLVPEPGTDGAEVAFEVADAMAEVSFDVGKVAACACREDSRRRTRIPAAAITTCTTRRAMRRTIGCGIAAPELAGTGQTRPLLPHHHGPKPLPSGLFPVDLAAVITCRELPENHLLTRPIYWLIIPR